MNTQRGFTLIELAIVLVILTVLAGGLLVPLTAQIESRRTVETKRTLEEARDAILGYAVNHTCYISCSGSSCSPTHSCDTTSCNAYCANPLVASGSWPNAILRHYLPCPDTDGDGLENRTGETCTQAQGNLPWVTLGAASQDAWGNRLQYSVSTSYANRSLGFTSGSIGPNQICDTSSGGCSSGNIAKDVPVLVLSHGSNGYSALSANGTTLSTPTGTDELENSLADADQKFVSRAPYKPADGSSSELAKEFDDMLIWIPTTLLTTRVCPAGGCL